VQEIKDHAFFRSIDWDNIRNRTPPYRPPISDKFDTSNFDNFDEFDPWIPPNFNKAKQSRIAKTKVASADRAKHVLRRLHLQEAKRRKQYKEDRQSLR
jgi:hypothetical protein